MPNTSNSSHNEVEHLDPRADLYTHRQNSDPTSDGSSSRHLDRVAALTAMVRRTPPDGCPVIPGSTPVISFGDFESAQVATLGINPSRAEFLDKHGHLLSGSARRLATLESLGAEKLDLLTDGQVAQVLADCRTYFQRNPFTKWFNQLNLPLAAIGANYSDGSACHLDISMWATDPVWNGLDAPMKDGLLQDGVPSLHWLLTHGGFSTIVVNGKAVWDQLEQTGLVTATTASTMLYSSKGLTTNIKKASAGQTRIVGWTLNVQSSFGVRTVDKVALGTSIRKLLEDW